MKRLLVSAVFVSVFFIGISGLIRSASASRVSDARAVELIKAARIAIGGDQNIDRVRSMTIKGSTTNFYEKAGIQDVKQGAVEMNFAFPGRFSKRVKIGTPGAETTDLIIGEEREINIEKIEGEIHPAGKENVFIVRKDGNEDVEWIGDGSESGADIKRKIRVEDGKVFIVNEDGTTKEIESNGKHKVIVMKDEDGKVTTSDIVGNEDANVWKSDDGQIHIVKEARLGGHHGSGEMARITMALLMTAPADGNVSYKFLGTGNVDGFSNNIIGVDLNGSTFKLYLDAGSNLPRMISYEQTRHSRVMIRKEKGGATTERIMRSESPDGPMTERQIKFSDFRTVGSLSLPHRWTEESNGRAIQNIDIVSYDINPADIETKFAEKGAGRKVYFESKKSN